MGRADQIYARLPVWGQHVAVTAYGLYWNRLRFGRGFRRFVDEYVQRDRWSQAQWRAWQTTRVRELLRVAAAHVPYYRSTWTASEKLAADEGQLEHLPLLGKEPLRADALAFVRDDVRVRRPLVFHTSGSTGTPIASIWTPLEYRNALALREVRSARWAGVSFKRPRATFSGRIVEPDPDSAGPFYRFNLVERQAYLSAFHLRRETAAAYVEALRRHRIEWLTGYAVSFYLLARFMIEDRIPAPSHLRAVITTSEKVTPGMRTTMERAFGCKVFEEYSTVENAVFASECEHHRLHVSPDSGIVELLRPDGSPVLPGEPGEVVATCLMRDYQPLIRFRLGDMAAWDPDPCPCGRGMPILREVLGRVEDVIIGPDGREMVRFHGIFTDQPHIREGQIIQETLTRIRVRVVPAHGYGQADADNVTARMHQRLGQGVEIVVEPVETIARTKAGKFQPVISMLGARNVG
jgi:phenylacetate-CoA ligase